MVVGGLIAISYKFPVIRLPSGSLLDWHIYVLQLGIWESILLLRYHGMSTVLKLLQKPQEFSIFFVVLTSYVQLYE